MFSAAITVVLVLTILSIGLSVAVEDLRATAGLETGSVVAAVAVPLFRRPSVRLRRQTALAAREC